MPKTTKTEAAADTVFAPIAKAQDMLAGLVAQIQIPEAARTAAVRGADAVLSQAATAKVGATGMTETAEKVMVSLAGASAYLGRGVVNASFDNVAMTTEAVKKLAAAPTAKDAAQISVDFLRDYGRANMARLTEAFDFVKATAQDNARLVQAEVMKFVPAGKKAA